MKLTCPQCNAKGELFLAGPDMVAYRCPKCGYVSDLMFRDDSKCEDMPSIVPRVTKRSHNLEDIKKHVAQLRSNGLTIDDIAYAFGVARSTLYVWARDDEELRDLLGVRTRKVKL